MIRYSRTSTNYLLLLLKKRNQAIPIHILILKRSRFSSIPNTNVNSIVNANDQHSFIPFFQQNLDK